MELQTHRLLLVAGTSSLGHAEIEDRIRFAMLLNADVPPSWPPPLNDVESMLWFTRYIESNPNSDGWVKWYFLLKRQGELPLAVGNGGFKGKANPSGTVEVGYAILEEYQRKGLATEAVNALIRWALSHDEVNRVIAHTFPELRPSIRVMEKCGLTYGGKGDEEGTIMYEFPRERLLQSAPNSHRYHEDPLRH